MFDTSYSIYRVIDGNYVETEQFSSLAYVFNPDVEYETAFNVLTEVVPETEQYRGYDGLFLLYHSVHINLITDEILQDDHSLYWIYKQESTRDIIRVDNDSQLGRVLCEIFPVRLRSGSARWG
jgi:hypothetical protein